MKIAVYTALIGDYDNLYDPFIVDENYDYYCFTNIKNLNSKIWKIVDIDKFESIKNLSDVRKCRYFKTHPHVVLSDYDYTFWVNANMIIKQKLSGILESQNYDSGFLVFPHPWRNCIYDESKELLKYNIDSKNVKEWVDILISEKYPTNNGLIESNVLFRKNSNDIININEYWWDIICKYSYRDQLSLNYVFWKLNFNYNVANFIARDSIYFKHVDHIKGKNIKPLNITHHKRDGKILTIIMPIYNQPKLVVRALNSIPIRDDVEVICIDDYSTDSTYDVLKDYVKQSKLDIVLLRNDKNSGIGFTTNRGIDLASGKWITDLDNDDYLLTDNYDKLIEMLYDLDEYDWVWLGNRVERNKDEIWYGEDRLAMWTYIAKRSFVGDNRFPLGRFHDADGIYTNELKKKNPKMFNSKICAYHYNWPRVGSVGWIGTHNK